MFHEVKHPRTLKGKITEVLIILFYKWSSIYWNKICAETRDRSRICTKTSLNGEWKTERYSDQCQQPCDNMSFCEAISGKYHHVMLKFNTVVPSKLISNLTSLCNWILDFLTNRPQSVQLEKPLLLLSRPLCIICMYIAHKCQ